MHTGQNGVYLLIHNWQGINPLECNTSSFWKAMVNSVKNIWATEPAIQNDRSFWHYRREMSRDVTNSPKQGLLWPILTSVRFLICENFQKYNLILFPIRTFKYMEYLQILNLKMLLNVVLNISLISFSLLKKKYFWNVSQNRNCSLVRMSH